MLSTIAGLPGNSFGWMVRPDKSWLFPPHSTWELPNFNCVSTSLEPPQLGCLPACLSPGTCMFPASMALPGFAVPRFPSLNTQQDNEVHRLPQCLPSHFQNLLPASNPYLKENLSMSTYGLGGVAAPNAIPGCQRRFVVFDQSGNETRLIYSSFGLTASKPTTAATKPNHGPYVHYEEYASKVDQMNLTKVKLHEESDENHLSNEESHMHEDTEEINALLYSDDDDYDDDDEVTSTGHSPILIRGSSGMQEPVEEITDEVASSDGPSKRQKLLYGGYKKSSLAVETASSVKVEGPHGYDDDAESSYAIGQTQEGEMVSILCNKQLREDKIRATLKIIESIIPGAKDKDPLKVLDEAIDYLKSLKLKAKTLGVNCL